MQSVGFGMNQVMGQSQKTYSGSTTISPPVRMGSTIADESPSTEARLAKHQFEQIFKEARDVRLVERCLSVGKNASTGRDHITINAVDARNVVAARNTLQTAGVLRKLDETASDHYALASLGTVDVEFQVQGKRATLIGNAVQVESSKIIWENMFKAILGLGLQGLLKNS
jgi:hypothetical protein